ncbi:MAG: hydantoinase B/oxoprolinase family protein [Lautropia sp.]
MKAIDVTTLATLQGALRAAVEEMNHVVVRTARSPVFKLAKDFSCSLCDWACRQMVQGRAELPVQVSSIPFVCQATADAYADSVADGDVFLCNDPASGGLHLNDVALLRPVFVGGSLLFWTVIRAHWQDVGGVAPADLLRAQSDCYGEGVRIPPLRIVEKGVPRQDVVALLFANMRFSERTQADLMSMQAASRIAGERLKALISRYGESTVRLGIEELYARLERQARDAIRSLPDGTYVGRSRIAARDDGAPIEFVAEVTIRGDSLAIRIDSPPQSRDVRNSPYAATTAAARHAVAISLGLRPPFNDGLYRAVTIDCGPLGSTANARVPPTATLGCTTQPFCELVDCVRSALALAIDPARRNAGWGAAASTNIFGHDPATGQFYGHFMPNAGSAGGAGAVHGQDGWSGVGSEANGGAVLLEPIELLEYEFPLRVHRMELRTDSGGAGRWRGGLGLDFEWEPIGHEQTARFHGVIDTYAALGVAGARSSLIEPKLGARCARDADGVVRSAGRDSRLRSGIGGKLETHNPGGGGVGDPFDRDPAAVLVDFREGLISAEGAMADYGVAVLADGSAIDHPATEKLRSVR